MKQKKLHTRKTLKTKNIIPQEHDKLKIDDDITIKKINSDLDVSIVINDGKFPAGVTFSNPNKICGKTCVILLI